MTEQKKKAAFIIRNFRDSGTEQRFTAGAVEQIDEGAFRNYEVAGLVRAPTAEETRAAAKAEAKPAATSTGSGQA